jgi:hypothetical protein
MRSDALLSVSFERTRCVDLLCANRAHETENVETILDADLQVGSAGLLRGGAVSWVQVEMADTLRGWRRLSVLTATTSMHGSIATTYQTGAQVVVCDNTLSAALNSSNAARIKVRHFRHSLNKLRTVRDALGIIHKSPTTSPPTSKPSPDKSSPKPTGVSARCQASS